MNIRKAALSFSGKRLKVFPEEVFKTKRLAKLDLSNNEIQLIPKEIGQLSHLETLNLSGNNIRILYAHLFLLPKLRTLILSNNKIVSIPKQISELLQLKILHLSNNRISQIPLEVGMLQSLEELNLNGNLINDLPLNTSTFPRLKRLWIAHNPLKALKSEILIENLKNIQSIYCFNSRITNPLVSKDKGLVLAAASKGNCLNILKDYAEDADFFKLLNIARKEDTIFSNAKSDKGPFLMQKNKGKIFVSYSHKDKIYLERLRTHLKVLSYELDFQIWDDTRITISERWKEAIERELNNASIAILLVSTDFLASEFIRNNELPQLLKSADDKGTKICSVIVQPCRFSQTKSIAQFQAANDPSEALSLCTVPRQEQIWLKFINDIQSLLEA